MRYNLIFRISFLFICFFILSCHNLRKTTKINNYKAIQVSMTLSTEKVTSNKTVLIADTTIVYNYNQIKIYKKKYEKATSTSDTVINGMSVMKLSDPIQIPYFLLNKNGDPFCYRLDSLNQDISLAQPLNLDSALQSQMATNFHNVYDKIKINYSLTDSINESPTITRFFYKNKEKANPDYIDSLFFYYSKEEKLQQVSFFTYYKDLDKRSNEKLFKVKLWYNENAEGKTEFQKISKSFTYELLTVPNNDVDILKLMKRFEQLFKK